ncbi:MAG: CHAD domain-containing protein [Chloroflexi bacterium]|nr:CHAD domain-containing protein [Chloroflexota bacterium]MCI0574630.1 CHAD domain-containing protein [Chloroflexota bacterium]MCI0645915.1 CHAD domain-containing protein [Chloroflexota bacterium]
MLTPEERTLLQMFVERNPPGTAYLRRVRLLLLSDSGLAPETAAGQVGVSINQARQWVRAFKRQRLALFPDSVLRPLPPFSPDDLMAEAGRQIMAGILQEILLHESGLQAGGLQEGVQAEAVHESRKAIRRLRTALQLFAPFFEVGLLDGYRRKFRKFMRRLGRSRDLEVFLLKLAQFREAGSFSAGERTALAALQETWQEHKAAADEEVQAYLARGKHQALLADFDRFTGSPGEGVLAAQDPYTPVKVRHLAPAFIYQQLAPVRAYEGRLAGASLTQWHALRVQGKKLRYTLEFFEPVLGLGILHHIATMKQMQECLGELNDARVALEFLAQTPEAEAAPAVALYRAAKEGEISELKEGFLGLWAEFDRPAWRQGLAAAVAVL